MSHKTPRDLLASMTRDEKIAQLLCISINDLLTDGEFDPAKARVQLGSGAGQVARIAGWSHRDPAGARALVRQVDAYLREETRLGIPAILHEESNCGFQSFGATVFPQAIGMAATWDLALLEEVHGAIRKEALALEIHSVLNPVLDLVVDPRWGRCEETFGEDRLLVGRMAIATVRGLQSDDLRSGVGATLKHFAGHGHSEGGRNEAPVHMGERELRDLSMVPFEMTIREARPLAVMNAYHDIDGIPCAANPFLLTDVLRGEWGFDGIVVSDYEAVDQVRRMHFLSADKAGAAALSLAAGLDIELPFPDCYAELGAAIDRGLASEADLDRSVLRVLEAKQRLGLLDDSRPAAPALDCLDSDEHRALARRAAECSMVMLRNEAVLPLAEDGGAIAVIGPFADETRNMLGDYAFASSYDLPDGTRGGPGVFSALRDRFARREVRMARGCHLNRRDPALLDAAVDAARQSALAVVVVGGRSGSVPVLRGFDQHGDMAGEGRDRADVALVPAQQEMVEAVAASGTPVVLVVVDGRPLALGAVAGKVAAIIYAFLPGHMGGEALARILAGDVAPSGRLPVSLAYETGQVPITYARHPASFKWQYIFGPNVALYPFGHGLTYADFTYEDLRLDADSIGADGETTLRFTIRNGTDRPAICVPQVYFRDMVASVVRPVMQLAEFERIALGPQEQREVAITLPASAFAFHDRRMQRVVEPGDFAIMIGESSGDIRLRATLMVTG
ncbi:glycoside hydrolase family 3 N-terminal domain-containing protein [Blastomonas fulva]|jgi:beta-glucosidase|uniref:glycoside hydrolase family 3 N-terminal domain-containing protein n=1 Tax=Blastomonas fulva TaxID=1550728 RepID=UPI003D29E48F